MAARSQAHEVKQHLDEVTSLRERLGTARWREEDWAIVDRVLESYEQLLSMLFEAQLTLTRLQTLLVLETCWSLNTHASNTKTNNKDVH